MSRRMLLSAAALLLAGCAGYSPDGGLGPTAQATRQHLGKDLAWPRNDADRQAIDARVSALLARPLSADDAVQIALLNNRGLQATFQELAIADAQRVQAGRLPNPGFSFGRLRQGDEIELERGLHIGIGQLLALPLRQRAATQQLAVVQQRVTAQTLALAASTRKAWVQAVAAAETVRYMQQVQQAADASAELARRMAAVGNFNKLTQAREQSFYADATLNVARAQLAQTAARERLTRLLGLWGAQTAFTLPDRLPELPAEPVDRPELERIAIAQRLDVQAARLELEQTASAVGATRVTSLIESVELGLMHNSSNEAPVQRGWELGFELPIFDWSGARVARADAIGQQAVHRAAQTAIDARSQVREAYAAYRGAWDIARHHRDEIVPLRRQIADENLLRYNGMLIGVFELLADARVQIASVNASIEALRDFWLAQADLEMALVGPSTPTATAGPSMAPEAGGGAGH